MTRPIKRVQDVVDGPAALVVFSRWENLELRDDGTGWTGYWRMDRKKIFDKVVMYLRDSLGINSVYVAESSGLREVPETGRIIIDLVNAQFVGTTNSNWSEFADAGSNPVRWVEARR